MVFMHIAVSPLEFYDERSEEPAVHAAVVVCGMTHTSLSHDTALGSLLMKFPDKCVSAWFQGWHF
jgi:hypothetical protein